MGYDNDCILKVDQEFFQPCDRVEIQVVGRLVEKKNIRIAEQSLCQQYFDLDGTWQICHLCVMIFSRNAKTI